MNTKATTISPVPWSVSEGGTLIRDSEGRDLFAYLGPWPLSLRNMALVCAAPAMLKALSDMEELGMLDNLGAEKQSKAIRDALDNATEALDMARTVTHPVYQPDKGTSCPHCNGPVYALRGVTGNAFCEDCGKDVVPV